MDPQVTFGIIAGCVALAAILVFLSLHILRREPKDLRERSKNGEILLLTFEQIMALYNAAPEKWEMQVDSPTYYPHGKERDGLLVFMLPKERKRYRKWFDWRLSHGEDAGQFQMTAKALLSMQEDLAGHLQRLQQSNEKALRESLEAPSAFWTNNSKKGGAETGEHEKSVYVTSPKQEERAGVLAWNFCCPTSPSSSPFL